MTLPSCPFGHKPSSRVAFGGMNGLHVYEPMLEHKDFLYLLNTALDAGYTMIDTAAMYGYGVSEQLISQVMHRRDEFTLATKGVYSVDDQGKMVTSGHPDDIRQHCHGSLKRLNTDFIDVYYLHRWDKRYPIEDQVGTVARLIEDGKVGAIGLSEVSAATLHKAHKEHPIAAVQSEYSLWTRNPEIAVIDACKELGAAFVAFSPMGRKFLSGTLTDPQQLPEWDFRRDMPRFDPDNLSGNLALLKQFTDLADAIDLLPAELAIAWVLAQGEHIIALPGTTSEEHLLQNAAASRLQLDQVILDKAGQIFNQDTVHGPRYNAKAQATVDTETFANE